MRQGKLAKIISCAQETSILEHLQTRRHRERDAAMLLLSMKAGAERKRSPKLPGPW